MNQNDIDWEKVAMQLGHDRAMVNPFMMHTNADTFKASIYEAFPTDCATRSAAVEAFNRGQMFAAREWAIKGMILEHRNRPCEFFPHLLCVQALEVTGEYRDAAGNQHSVVVSTMTTLAELERYYPLARGREMKLTVVFAGIKSECTVLIPEQESK